MYKFRNSLIMIALSLMLIKNVCGQINESVNLNSEVYNFISKSSVCTADCYGNPLCVSSDIEIVHGLFTDFFYDHRAPLYIIGQNISCVVEKANIGDENANQFLVVLTKIVLKQLEKGITHKDHFFVREYFSNVLGKWNTSQNLDLYEAFLKYDISLADLGVDTYDYLSINIMMRIVEILISRYELGDSAATSFSFELSKLSRNIYSECNRIYDENGNRKSPAYRRCRQENRPVFQKALIDFYREYVKGKQLKTRYRNSF